MPEPTRVMLVDDHAVVREGYRRLLERDPGLRVCAEAADAAAAYADFCRAAPDVVVMDIALPGTGGIELTRRLQAREGGARVLMFSMHDEAIFVSKALEAGAAGYITKASAPEVLVDAVHAVANGRRYLSRDAARALAGLASAQEADRVAALSPREFEILAMLVQGQSLDAIAHGLHLSAKTVANLQSAIKQKLGAANMAQLLRIAVRSGIAV